MGRQNPREPINTVMWSCTGIITCSALHFLHILSHLYNLHAIETKTWLFHREGDVLVPWANNTGLRTGIALFFDEIKVISTKDGWWLLSFSNCILSVWVSLAGPTESHKCLQELEPDNSLWCRVRDDWRWNMKNAMCKMMQYVRCRLLEGGYPSSVEVIEENEDFVVS